MPGPKQNTKRTLLGNSTYIFLIRVFPALASLAVLITYSRYFDTTFFGRYQRFWVQFQVYSAIACLGLPALILTYPLEQLKDFIRHTSARSVAMGLLWLGLTGLVFSLHLFPKQDVLYACFSCAFLISNALIACCEAYLIVGRRFGFVTIASFGYACYFIAAHAMLLYRQISFGGLLLCLLCGSLIRCAALLIRSFHQYRATPMTGTAGGARSRIRSLWLHLGIYDILQTIFRWADKFILTFFLSNELLAVYVNGTVDIPFLPLLLGAVGSALLLHLGEADTADKDRVRLLSQSSAKLALVVFPLFFFFVFFRYELFSVVFNGKYAAAVPLFLISSLVIPLRAYNFTSILQFKGKGRVINAGAALDLGLALLLMYPLYLVWQLNGIALAFVVSTYVQAGFYLWHTARQLRCPVLHLLPLGAWARSGLRFLLVFFIGHYLLSSCFDEHYTLLLGCCLVTLTITVALAQQLLSKRKQ